MTLRRATPSSDRHAGFSTIELLAATSLLAAVLLFALPLLSRVRDLDRASARHAFALRELRNVVERAQLPANASNPTAAAAREQGNATSPENVPLPDYVQRRLPRATLQFSAAALADDTQAGPRTLRRTATLSWSEPAGGLRSVQLSWWTVDPTADPTEAQP